VTLEPSSVGGGVRSRSTHDSMGALPNREVGSGATGHVAAPEPTMTGWQGSMLKGTWLHVEARLILYLDLKLAYKVPGLQCTDRGTYYICIL
jgi:hypothetical protein